MDYNRINEYLVDIFNRVQVIEETSLRTSQFNDVSLKEMHTIEIIGKNSNVTPSDIARELMLTLGTITTRVLVCSSLFKLVVIVPRVNINSRAISLV